MDKNKHVYCTRCIHCKLDDMAHTNCGHEHECNCLDPEDSRSYLERPFYIDKFGMAWMCASLEDSIDLC